MIGWGGVKDGLEQNTILVGDFGFVVRRWGVCRRFTGHKGERELCWERGGRAVNGSCRDVLVTVVYLLGNQANVGHCECVREKS